MFYGEFQNINSTGISTKGLILIAEIVSCAKRTLARYVVTSFSNYRKILKLSNKTIHKYEYFFLTYF